MASEKGFQISEQRAERLEVSVESVWFTMFHTYTHPQDQGSELDLLEIVLHPLHLLPFSNVVIPTVPAEELSQSICGQ